MSTFVYSPTYSLNFLKTLNLDLKLINLTVCGKIFLVENLYLSLTQTVFRLFHNMFAKGWLNINEHLTVICFLRV